MALAPRNITQTKEPVGQPSSWSSVIMQARHCITGCPTHHASGVGMHGLSSAVYITPEQGSGASAALHNSHFSKNKN